MSELFGLTIQNIFGAVVILLLNVMELLNVGRCSVRWIMYGLNKCVCVCCACDPTVHPDTTSIGFVCGCRKLRVEYPSAARSKQLDQHTR